MIVKDVFCKRLKEVRLEAKLSQRELGILAGMDPAVASARMNRYELGIHAPDFLMLRRIADVLNVPAAYFYAEDDGLAYFIKAYHR